jgi:two-component sensor histidine kinase
MIRFEARYQWPDGVVKWIAVRAQIVTSAEGVPLRVIGVAMDVTERRRREEQLQLTAHELQHRVKNNLAVVQSIATQSFRGSRSKEESIAAFSGRLQALALATDLLTTQNWDAVPIAEIVTRILRPFSDEWDKRITIAGPAIAVSSTVAVNLGMALHELCTNAVKYGALSNDKGTVSISWRTVDQGVVIDWREAGGPPVVPPSREGFGTKLLKRGVLDAGQIVLNFDPAGVHCSMAIGREHISAAR